MIQRVGLVIQSRDSSRLVTTTLKMVRPFDMQIADAWALKGLDLMDLIDLKGPR